MILFIQVLHQNGLFFPSAAYLTFPNISVRDLHTELRCKQYRNRCLRLCVGAVPGEEGASRDSAAASRDSARRAGLAAARDTKPRGLAAASLMSNTAPGATPSPRGRSGLRGSAGRSRPGPAAPAGPAPLPVSSAAPPPEPGGAGAGSDVVPRRRRRRLSPVTEGTGVAWGGPVLRPPPDASSPPQPEPALPAEQP